ncbi:MAG: hypothetical protein ABR955_05575 [Verrucomicrobiota bacterium]
MNSIYKNTKGAVSSALFYLLYKIAYAAHESSREVFRDARMRSFRSFSTD